MTFAFELNNKNKFPDVQNFHWKFTAVASKKTVTYRIGHPEYLCSGLDT